jgi:hypothetical protein
VGVLRQHEIGRALQQVKGSGSRVRSTSSGRFRRGSGAPRAATGGGQAQRARAGSAWPRRPCVVERKTKLGVGACRPVARNRSSMPFAVTVKSLGGWDAAQSCERWTAVWTMSSRLFASAPKKPVMPSASRMSSSTARKALVQVSTRRPLVRHVEASFMPTAPPTYEARRGSRARFWSPARLRSPVRPLDAPPAEGRKRRSASTHESECCSRPRAGVRRGP